MYEESVPADIVGYVSDFLTREMKPLPVSGVDVAVAPDQDGDPILLIDVKYGGTAEAVDPKAIARLITALCVANAAAIVARLAPAPDLSTRGPLHRRIPPLAPLRAAAARPPLRSR